MVKKNCIIVQARQTSKRLKNKIFMKLGDTSAISFLHSRLKKIKNTNLVYAIPDNKRNDKLYRVLKKLDANIFRGSEDDVLDRFYKAAKKFKAENIIRITGDCPFNDPQIIKKILQLFLKKKVDYVSNVVPPSFPDGFDVEVFHISTLEKVKKIVKDHYDKEHVTSLLRREKSFKKYNFSLNKDYNYMKLSVDTMDDLKNIKKVFKLLKYDKNFSYKDIIKNKKIKKLFKDKIIMKNNLRLKNKKSQIHWKKAKKLIPGGNMLLSKNPDRHLKNFWPAYYKSARGCKIKDYDNNIYTDLYLMGVGTNILGYGNKEIDSAVKKSLSNGNMSSLNCFEEVQLAENLIKIHPQFDMAKFAKTGGEANSVAIRIARAASGRDKVAICGYHGWHDWYLAAGLNKGGNKNFRGHLANDLGIEGVPKSLKKTTFAFEYGNYQQFNKIIDNNNIGVVKMEVCRKSLPDKKFIKHVREKTKKKNIVLIFDECTTGFRQSFGGIHKIINIYPDMLILGKALGNGYPITCILGKESIMRSAQKTFISSTFWTERSGYVAALKTLEIMKRIRSWEKITKIGKNFQANWTNIFASHGIDYEIFGFPAVTGFAFKNNHDLYRKFITQEMLKSNILAGSIVYASVSQTETIINSYFDKFNQIIKKISYCEHGSDIKKYLNTELI
jgi:glutamate-1-semialdehyde 2,1-aminomutase